MKTYRMDGYNLQEDTVIMLLDCDPDEDFYVGQLLGERAQAIAPGYHFVIHGLAALPETLSVPDDCKGILFNSEQELYARNALLCAQLRHHDSMTRKELTHVHIVQVVGGKQPDGTPMDNKYMADGWYGTVDGTPYWAGPQPTPEAVIATWGGGKAVFDIHAHPSSESNLKEHDHE
jgi:hypothetical protein